MKYLFPSVLYASASIVGCEDGFCIAGVRGAGGGDEAVFIPWGGGTGLSSLLQSSCVPPFISLKIPGGTRGGLDATLGA